MSIIVVCHFLLRFAFFIRFGELAFHLLFEHFDINCSVFTSVVLFFLNTPYYPLAKEAVHPRTPLFVCRSMQRLFRPSDFFFHLSLVYTVFFFATSLLQCRAFHPSSSLIPLSCGSFLLPPSNPSSPPQVSFSSFSLSR